MSSVDNRIVKMSMDNAQFTTAANSTMSTLKNLDNSLKLADGTKGLDAIGKTAKGVDMSHISSALDTIQSRFSVTGMMAVTALTNITNSAVNAGKRLVSSLTLDPVMDGFREYETKMDAIQTILTNTSAKGTSLDDINGALAELNEYSDKTIYNFAQMTDNIGKATAAGVGLEDSVTFVKGMSNVAAGFGVDATRMAGATYQMTQALSAGVIKLQDWKSLEQSGMGGQMIQDELVKTAKEMGVFVDESIPFRETLESSWLSSEVFIKTMDKMANDPSLTAAAQNVTSLTKLIGTMQESVGSGWAVTWEHIFGNKEDSTALFTGISNGFSDISGAMAEYRNSALATWSAEGGREAVIKGLAAVVKVLGQVLGPVYESFKKIIDPWNSDRLLGISKGFLKVTESLKITDKTSELLSRTADGVFSIFSIIGKVLGSAAMGIGSVLVLLSPMVDGFLSVTAAIGDYIVRLNSVIKTTNVVGKAITAIKNTISNVSTFIGDALSKLGEGITNLTNIDLSGIKSFGNRIKESFTPTVKTTETVGGAVDKFQSIIDRIKGVIEKLIPVITTIASKVKSALSTVADAIIGVLGGEGNALKNVVNAGLLGSIALSISKIYKFFKNFETDFGGVRGIVDTFKNGIDGIVSGFKQVCNAVTEGLQSVQANVKAGTLKKIAVSIAILAASLLVIAMIDSEKLLTSLGAIGALMGGLVGSMALLDKLNGSKVGMGVMAFAASILILSVALKQIGAMSWESIGKGLAGIAAMMILMVAATKALSNETANMVKTSMAIIIFSGAVRVMTGAVEKMGSLDTAVLIKGLAGVAGAMLAIVGFTKIIDDSKSLVSTSISMAVLSGALIIMASAIEKMGSVDTGVLIKGILGYAGAILAIGAALKVMPKDTVIIAAGLVVLGVALMLIQGVLSKLGSMSWEEIARGLVALGGALLILGVAMYAMTGCIAGAAALMVMAVALSLLIPPLMLLGAMSLSAIGVALLALAGVFGVLGLASLILSPLAPVLLLLGVAIGILGVACVSIGAGISAFAAGLAVLAVSGLAGATALVGIVKMIIGLVPMIAAAIAEGIVKIIQVFLENTATVAAALSTFLISIITSLTSAIPSILELISTIVTGVLELMIENTPLLVESVMTVIVTLLQALNENLPTIATYVTESLTTLITTVLTKIAEGIPDIAAAIVDVIVAILNAIGDGIPRIVDGMYDLVINMINGLTNTIKTRMPEVRTALKGLVKAIIEEFKACIKDAVSVGGDIVGGLKKGISNGVEAVAEAARSVASGALNAAKKFLGIHSPSREFAKLGMYSDQGLANGLNKYSGVVEDSATSVGDAALSSMQTALSSVNDLLSDDMDSSPVIRPVLDLTNIQNGKSQIGSLIGGDSAIQVAATSARRTASGFMSKDVGLGSGTTTNTNTTNQTEVVNHFNITGDNPREIAEEVSRIIQTQVERRGVVWE